MIAGIDVYIIPFHCCNWFQLSVCGTKKNSIKQVYPVYSTMGKSDKNKINIKERVDDITIDLSLSDISEIPVSGIVSGFMVFVLTRPANW